MLVTGADGFVGSWLVPRLAEAGHQVMAAVGAGEPTPETADRLATIRSCGQVVRLELRNRGSVEALNSHEVDAVVHLAGISSGSEALEDPGLAWEVNAAGVARLAEVFGARKRQGTDPVFLLVSTAEVYGAGPSTLRVETDPVRPCSPYAASKLGGEIAALEVHRRTGLRVIIARPFAHSGPGQDQRFVIPTFAHRILMAKKVGAPVVAVGNLDPVREFLHVADVVEAYMLLLERGRAGEVYNIASGQPVDLREVFLQLAEAAKHRAIPEVDTGLVRPADIPYLVGNGAKVRAETGWQPARSLSDVVVEVLDAQTH